eukprot:4910815-Amphidinium_carterae.2
MKWRDLRQQHMPYEPLLSIPSCDKLREALCSAYTIPQCNLLGGDGCNISSWSLLPPLHLERLNDVIELWERRPSCRSR